MQIGRNWMITIDSMNIIVSKRQIWTKKDTGEKYEIWPYVGFFSNLNNALKYLIEQEVRDSDLKDLQAVIDRIAKAEKMIDIALKTSTSHKEAVEIEKPRETTKEEK